MPVNHREIAFEEAIEHHLLTAAGFTRADRDNFDRERAIDPTVLLPFIKETQPEQWKNLETLQGASAETVLLDDLCKTLDSQGALAVIRHGFKCFGKPFRVAFFAPAHGMNPETQSQYQANRLTITRQLKYSTRNENSIDVVLSLNGLPVATAELKNHMSGQTVADARNQYRSDRDPRELIFQFKKRTMVHFAVDPDEVYMTTHLDGQKTFFLPFNKGNERAAGNPENPGGYKTAYLWEQVWQRDSFLDILARFIHLQIEEKKVGGKTVERESMIFPRYHQLDAVRKLEVDARKVGTGTNYLIEHSAGSGKSNSIAWLAHRLQSLHDEQERKVFDSVIVITDRVVLDRQLQDTIYQFEHRQGVVQKIDEDAAQLAQALKAAVPIIITTLQKFPFVTKEVGTLENRHYAVIIDEAHSSQSGEAAAELKGALAGAAIRQQAREQAEAEGLADYEEEILKTMARRGRQPNISFFAFTATPKYKTLSVFGHLGPDGKPVPFHVYSMRQAIEEGFILDVLKSYTTYKTFYRLIKTAADDPQVSKGKAAQALARFIRLNPHNIAKKTEVLVEHFWNFSRHKVGGKAKAMVVTGSRLEAVRFRQAFDKYVAEKGYMGINALVAFSGTVDDPDVPDVSYTEPDMNRDAQGKSISETRLREVFDTDEYNVLIVAEKYQTGFDQPRLHSMYIDKRLSGIQAVQTLSRLNRTCPGKEDTFVLDFVNPADEIRESFKPYYEQTLVGEQSDPHQLYELQAKLNERHIFYLNEVEDFARVFFKPKAQQSPSDHSKLNALLDQAVGRSGALIEDEQEEFRGLLGTFRNLYGFLSQVIPFQDSDLEKLYTYVRFLLTKLPHRASGPFYDFEDDVALKYYRLQKLSEGSISLQPGDTGEVKGPTAVGTRQAEDPQVELSQLIDVINERFGTEFTPADQLFFDQIREDAAADGQLQEAALANTPENFKFVFDKKLEGLFIDRMDQNTDIFARFMNDRDFQRLVAETLLKQVYSKIRGEGPAA